MKLRQAHRQILLSVLSTLMVVPSLSRAHQVREFIDGYGDGAGNLLHRPLRVAVDSAGNVFAGTKYAATVFKVTPGGEMSVVLDRDNEGHCPSNLVDMAIDGGDNLIVSCDHGVYKVTPAGEVTQILDASGDGNGNLYGEAGGITIDGMDNIYTMRVSGPEGDQPVLKIAPDGVISTVLNAVDGSGPAQPFLRSLHADRQGNLVLGTADTVFRMAPDGTITEVFWA